jgi:hypothetical protein
MIHIKNNSGNKVNADTFVHIMLYNNNIRDSRVQEIQVEDYVLDNLYIIERHLFLIHEIPEIYIIFSSNCRKEEFIKKVMQHYKDKKLDYKKQKFEVLILSKNINLVPSVS